MLAVAFAENQRNQVREMRVAGALGTVRRGDAKNETILANRWAVRRLTPRECERLQGFPDDHTLVPFGNKPMPDGQRYKMCGNSMAVNVIDWLGERIEMDLEANAGLLPDCAEEVAA
jgi:DNA (cytosine-5)-methyltransferase 1